MGLYLLNISVDPIDPNPEHIAEDLSINDQESIIEIVFEKVLGYEDAIKEYDDHDTEDHTKKAHVKIDLTTHSVLHNNLNKSFIDTAKKKFPNYTVNLKNGFQKLDIPPPKI
ncbi:hypothetical protein [Leeuwenhoekiella parthenopeia]|uniref:Uncharacterized protein n=1 Tax=Leeuwenhoekiella parthenopeia TaxID=2890320 RepID=A0ABS8GSS8_9FLAO|nr:hypothetical protein [Leeuwenhoekiella parthenopeia]MCC4213062.1 hypothetical protein [Leeuwenhoekiella parthenopeia]